MRNILYIFFAAFVMAMASSPERVVRRLLPEVSLNGMPFRQIEVALTAEEHRKGLMNRDYLADDGGMLFFYGQPQVVSFWMKNTRIPLDILFLDAEGVILQVNTMPAEAPQGVNEGEATYERRLRRYPCGKPVHSVLEIRAGRAEELGLVPGLRLPEFASRVILQNIILLGDSAEVIP